MSELDFGAPFKEKHETYKRKDRMIKSLIKRHKNSRITDRELHKRMTTLMQDYDLFYKFWKTTSEILKIADHFKEFQKKWL